jgi:hypothetical protein
MRSLTFTRVAILTAALLTGCGSESNPTDVSTPASTAYAIAHNAADHFTAVDPVTYVDTREHLDAGNSLHAEFQQHTTATGTGSETGATYTINDIYHESFESPNPPAPHVTFGANGMTRVSSDVAGLSFSGHFVFQAVIPSGQDFKVTTSLERVTCG